MRQIKGNLFLPKRNIDRSAVPAIVYQVKWEVILAVREQVRVPLNNALETVGDEVIP